MYETGNEVHEIHHQKQTCFHLPAGTVADRRHDTADTTGQQSEGSQHSRQEAQSQAAGTGGASAGISRNKVIPCLLSQFFFTGYARLGGNQCIVQDTRLYEKLYEIHNLLYELHVIRRSHYYTSYTENRFSVFLRILP